MLENGNVPPRSRLYSLVPCGLGTIFCESFTGYLNRLGSIHHVSPRALATEMIVPLLDENWQLTFTEIGLFSTLRAMSLNEGGIATRGWIDALKQLTARTDLHLLTLGSWIGDLPRRGQLRETPAWCPLCLQEWQDKGHPISQPLLWTFRIVTICPHHRNFLLDRCPSCQRRQTIMTTNKTRPGECTSCATWLGTGSGSSEPDAPNDELLAWQGWVIHVLSELLGSDQIQWEPFFRHLRDFLQRQKAYSRLAQVTGIDREALHRWGNNNTRYIPLFPTILKFCYICHVTPLQVMRNQLYPLQQVIAQGTDRHSPFPRHHPLRVDQARAQILLQALLDGKNAALGVSQIAQRLGCDESLLLYHFPQECTEIAKQAKASRQQHKELRLAHLCEQVRQTTIAVHHSGRYPSQDTVQSFLPRGLMRMSEARAAWRATLRELGYEL
jgi:DNA-binding phage protein/ribosomal protein S27E